MKTPTMKQAKGYDCVVWIDEEGDVVCQAYTPDGTKFLKDIDARYNHGDVLEIVMHPEEFKQHVPPSLKLGALTGKKVRRLNSAELQ